MLLPDEKAPQQQELAVLEEPTYAIVEGNLHRHHFASLSPHSAAKDRKISEVVEQGKDEKGLAYTRKWKVIGGVEYGFPNWLDEKVLVALIDLGRRRCFPVQNPIQVKISDLCRYVGLDADSGRNRDKIRTCLKRIRDVTIEASGALYFRRKKAWIDDRFSVIQRVAHAGETLDDGTQATCTLVWLSDKILDNINERHIVPLDTRFFMQLRPAAGRLYQLLATRFFGLFMHLKQSGGERGGAYIVETYHDLCRRMPLEAQEFPSRAKQQFRDAHKQLLNNGFLAKVEWLPSNDIRYYPGLKAAYDFDNAMRNVTKQLQMFDMKPVVWSGETLTLEIEGPRKPGNGAGTLELLPDVVGAVRTPEGLSSEQIEALSKELQGRGVSARQAADLVTEFGHARTAWNGREYPTIDFYLQFFDFMQNAPQPKKPKSGAWIVKAIREAWGPELDFRTREEQADAARVAAEAKKRQKQAERAQEEAATRQQYLEWLRKTPEQRWSRFLFEMEFKREQGREPTPQETAEARAAYLAAPETPEAYQVRVYGKVKFPLSLEEGTA